MYTSQPCPHPGGALGGSPSLHPERPPACPRFARGDDGPMLLSSSEEQLLCSVPASPGRSVRVSGCSAGLRQLSPQMPPKVRAQRPTQSCGYCQKEVWANLLGTLGPQPFLAGLSPTATHPAAPEENPGLGHMGLPPPWVSLRLSPDLGPTRSQHNCLMTSSDLGARSAPHSSPWRCCGRGGSRED